MMNFFKQLRQLNICQAGLSPDIAYVPSSLSHVLIELDTKVAISRRTFKN